MRKAFRRVIKRPHNFVPIAEGFGAAVPSGGWGMFPDRLAAPRLGDGSFVRVKDIARIDRAWPLSSSALSASVNAGMMRFDTAVISSSKASQRIPNVPK